MGAASTEYVSKDEAIVRIYVKLIQATDDELQDVLDALLNSDIIDIRIE